MSTFRSRVWMCQVLSAIWQHVIICKVWCTVYLVNISPSFPHFLSSLSVYSSFRKNTHVQFSKKKKKILKLRLCCPFHIWCFSLGAKKKTKTHLCSEQVDAVFQWGVIAAPLQPSKQTEALPAKAASWLACNTSSSWLIKWHDVKGIWHAKRVL